MSHSIIIIVFKKTDYQNDDGDVGGEWNTIDVIKEKKVKQEEVSCIPVQDERVSWMTKQETGRGRRE